MEIQHYLDKMRTIQTCLLEYIDSEDESEKFYLLETELEKLKFQDNKYELESLLLLISKISNNHHRTDDFFYKIEKVLQIYKIDMKKYFTNPELFHIFKKNKRILLYLFEEKILTFDETIAKIIISGKYLLKNYPQYFTPEIQPFLNKTWFPKYNKKTNENAWVNELQKELLENFEEKRKNGQNDNYICKLIQKDSIEEFIKYINEKSISLNSKIELSVFETNSLLLKKNEVTLIEYALFYGSIQIIKYMENNNVEFNESSCFYAIHSNNSEIISIFINDDNKQDSYNMEKYRLKCIKCHHNEVANFIQTNFLHYSDSHDFFKNLKYFNFSFIQNESIDKSSFFRLCKYNYGYLVKYFMEKKNFDINAPLILITNL